MKYIWRIKGYSSATSKCDRKVDHHCGWDFPKSASNEFPFESLSSGYSDVFNVKKKTRIRFPDFLGFRPCVFYLQHCRSTTEMPRKCERFSRETTKSMVSPAMRPEQHGESGTMKVRPNDRVCVCFRVLVRLIERITVFFAGSLSNDKNNDKIMVR